MANARSSRTLLLLAGAMVLSGAGSLYSQAQERPTGGPRGEPTQSQLDACVGSASGDQCEVTGRGGRAISGICQAPPGRSLACLQERSTRRTRAGDDQSAELERIEIAASAADTRSVLCDLQNSSTHSGTGLPSDARWSCSGEQRLLVANGVPDHATGEFPNAHNPHSISAQQVSFATSLTPIAHEGLGVRVKVPGFALNGIRFDPGTAGSCNENTRSRADCSMGGNQGPWRLEALGQSSFNFGDDENHAHVQPDGAYHYHGVPEGLLSEQAKAGASMALIGWASDGYPMYARFGHDQADSASSPLRAMRTSWQLKSQPDAGRPDVQMIPMGTFNQDYQYVEGSGDLDDCNGRVGVTPEFPEGIYHYYATDQFPFVQRCVKGTPNEPERGPPPRGARP